MARTSLAHNLHRSEIDRGIFGRGLEASGRHEMAVSAFRCAGFEDEALRVERNIKILGDSRFLEKHGLYVRAMKLLLEDDLHGEANALAKRLANDGSCDALYAKGLLAIRNENWDLTGQILQDLYGQGPRGIYLAALLCLEVDSLLVKSGASDLARYIAGSFSGKKTAHDEHGEDVVQKMLPLVFTATDSKQVAGALTGMLAWGISSNFQQLYYALRIYQKLGNVIEASRCLAILRESTTEATEDEYYSDRNYQYLNGLIALIGRNEALERAGNLIDKSKPNTWIAILTVYIAKDGVEKLIEDLEESYGETDPQKCIKAYDSIICCGYAESALVDQLDIADLKQFIERRDAHRERLRKVETDKIELVETAIGKITDYSDVKVLVGTVRDINFRAVLGDSEGEKERMRYMLRLAEISARFTEDSEAQNFAGAIFIQNNEGAKAVECVKRLLALGKTADADEIAISTIPSLSDDGRIALAQELETSDPVLSCRLYQHASDWKNFARIAGNIIDSGTLYEVRNIAWLISVTHRQNILMRDALTKLESFGEEGARMVKGIRMEMRIRHLFEVSEIGARSDALSG